MARFNKDIGFTALHVEGGLLPPEFLQAVSRLEAKGQTNADYHLTRSQQLKDEIGRYWRMACDLWTEYKERRERQDLDIHQVTVKDWLVPLFEDVLGYHDMTPTGSGTVGERRFPIDFHAAGRTVPLVLTTANHELDRAAAPFGDEGRRRSPHGLVQEYLNAATGCLWGIVANGRQMRLLRDNPSLTRPAYIEADLERVRLFFYDGGLPKINKL